MGEHKSSIEYATYFYIIVIGIGIIGVKNELKKVGQIFRTLKLFLFASFVHRTKIRQKLRWTLALKRRYTYSSYYLSHQIVKSTFLSAETYSTPNFMEFGNLFPLNYLASLYYALIRP